VVRRTLVLGGVERLIDMDSPEPIGEGLGAPQAAGQTGGTGRYGLAQHLRTVSAVPAGHDIVDAALRLVVALAQAAVGGADGVSVSLRRHGQLSTVAASDQTIMAMDTDQYATGEGPCVDASVHGRWFHAESLHNESRWPAFTPKALGLGINSILSSPLVVRDRPIGALNIYSRTPAAFAAADQRLASVFATEVSTVLAGAGADVTADQLAERLEHALVARQIIALAQGVLMERGNLDADSAYTALRRCSVKTGRPLRERAEDVVASTRSPLDPSTTRENYCG
jgi:GAF domain-containing protein